MKEVKCLSCGKELNRDGVVFKCPSCGKHIIIRCNHCRKVGVKYKCECDFEGP